jgi:hypothetical protein
MNFTNIMKTGYDCHVFINYKSVSILGGAITHIFENSPLFFEREEEIFT